MGLEEFGHTTERKQFTSDFKKTQFLDLNSTAVIRVLSKDRFVTATHWLNRVQVLCLEDGCPICTNNKLLRMQYPDTYKEETRYSPKRTVKLINVLDKTLTKVCPNCLTENRVTGTATACKKCNQILTNEAAPLRKVKVLSRGVELFDQLDSIHNAVLDSSGEKIGITKYDITLVVSNRGKNKVITPIGGQVGEEEVVNPDELYDLSISTLKLEPAEMVDFQRGVSLRDIFAARKASKETNLAGEVEVLSHETSQQIQDEVDKLFGVK